MSENKEKKARTVAEIQQEYQVLCVRSGHTQYQIATMSKDLELLNSSMRDLNFEAAAVQAQQSNAEAAKVEGGEANGA